MKLKKCFVAGWLAAALAAAQLPLREDNSPVVMTVDGRDVTAAEVQKILSLQQPDFMKQYQVNPQAALMNWYIMNHLGREAEARKLDQTSPIKETLEAFRMNLLAGALINNEVNAYPVSSEMAQTYYDAHRAEYEQVSLKAIYISFNPSSTTSSGTSAEALQRAAQEALAGANAQRSEEQARLLAQEVVRQLRGGGDFAKLVEAYSEDPVSKPKGGDFGAVKASSPYPEDFRKAVMALEKGAISDPIRQPTGFYIVRVEDKGVPPLEQVRTEINAAVRQEHVNQMMQELSARFNPVVKDPSFFAPKQQSAPAPFSITGK
jgi:parvulin-like peptidyl-prolyl isomerase